VREEFHATGGGLSPPFIHDRHLHGAPAKAFRGGAVANIQIHMSMTDPGAGIHHTIRAVVWRGPCDPNHRPNGQDRGIGGHDA
jgi:hypothetical protein